MDWIDQFSKKLDSFTNEIIQKIIKGKEIQFNEALYLFRQPIQYFPLLFFLATHLRDKFHGNIISFSKNVFIDITHLCRNACSYCGFRKDPSETNTLLLKPKRILERAHRGKKLGCKEALLTMGEKPEQKYPSFVRELREIGDFSSTTEYLYNICEKIINKTGLLPHSNPGLLNKSELRSLKEVNASLGLMLESTSENLSKKGGAHEKSPGKDPTLRLKTIKLAGELKIPFTTGILIGIGESSQDRIHSLFTIKKINEQYGHIQEIIIQNFLPKPNTPMGNSSSPPLSDMLKIVCIARLIFQGKMNIQIPPNLNKNHLPLFLMSGINDWGGISPITKDYINPETEWPSLQQLAQITHHSGCILKERLPIYPEFIHKDEFISLLIKDHIHSLIDIQGFVKNG
ncbi:MAG: 7,8-didemethyl-8-hydroxy-5-deazariboflavin synthase CofG [Candidatus Helarchaeota archaeon]